MYKSRYLVPLLLGLVVSCSQTSKTEAQAKEKFVAVEAVQRINPVESSLPEIIMALPPFSFHEAAQDYVREQMASQSVFKTNFRGGEVESMRYNGDGSAGSSTFYFDRKLGLLWRHYHAWEMYQTESLSRYRLVANGWMVSDESSFLK